MHDRLTARGYRVTVVQNPLTSLADDVAATRRVLDSRTGPTLLVGHSWGGTVITEAGEHLATNIVMRRLAASFDAVGPNLPPPPAIIGAPPGVLHEIGLLAFAVALRRQGVAALYLGAQVPPKAWSAAVGATNAVINVTAIPRRADARQAAALVADLAAAHPDVPVAVGGRFQHLAPPQCLRLGHHIPAAAREVARLVAGTRP